MVSHHLASHAPVSETVGWSSLRRNGNQQRRPRQRQQTVIPCLTFVSPTSHALHKHARSPHFTLHKHTLDTSLEKRVKEQPWITAIRPLPTTAKPSSSSTSAETVASTAAHSATCCAHVGRTLHSLRSATWSAALVQTVRSPKYRSPHYQNTTNTTRSRLRDLLQDSQPPRRLPRAVRH